MSLPGRDLPGMAILLLAFILLLSGFALPARAADDSNSGQLAQTPPVSSQDLNSALSSLAQGTNDTQLQQQLSQLESQLNKSNYSGAASTLVQLQNLSNSDPNTPISLKALLQSLSIGGSGAVINPNTLASLLKSAPYGQGANESPQKLSLDMQTLANLMKGVNPSFASSLLQNSTLLSQAAFGVGGNAGGGKVPLPGSSSLGGIPIPSVGAPALSVGAPGATFPSISPATFAIPVLLALGGVSLFLARKRVASLVGSQALPGMSLLRRSTPDDRDLVVPSDPRRRIEYYFGRAVRLMARRGLPKPDSETHREFSSRLDRRPEEPQVKTITSLYERAKFSGQAVGAPDAETAAAAFFNMEAEKR